MDQRSLSRTCGGTGWLDCECGGDFCVCTLHGGIDCPGCTDCRESSPGDDDDDYHTGTCDECGTRTLLDSNTELCGPCYRKLMCATCGDELRTGRTHEEAGTCPTCDPTCWQCVEHPCICQPEPAEENFPDRHDY